MCQCELEEVICFSIFRNRLEGEACVMFLHNGGKSVQKAQTSRTVLYEEHLSKFMLRF